MISILILLFTCILLLYKPYRYYKMRQIINKIPGPPGIMILGNTLELDWTIEGFWKTMRILNDKYYPIHKLWILSRPLVVITHPDDMETILSNSKHLMKGNVYKLLYSWLGTGLLTSTGNKWHTRRKILTPAFHFNILRQFVDVLVEEGDHMTKSLRDNGEPVVKDLTSFISEHTLNAICETAMGTSLRDFDKFQHEYRQTVWKMGDLLIYRLGRPWLTDRLFSFTSMGKMQTKYLSVLHGFTNKVIAERKLYHEQTDGQYLKSFDFENNVMSESNDEKMTETKRKRLAMLDLLIAQSQENRMSDSDIREEVDTFMFEGHDTTAMGICFALALLAEHKDIQERVREEVNSISQEAGGKLIMASLQKLSYLERCLKETLRLYPSVPSIARVTGEDVVFQSYVVPAKTDVRLNIYDLHRDANFWPNPEVFDPDRFLPDQIQYRHPYSYIPFSAGLRNCIGQRFAMLEMKAMIAPLVQNFYIEAIDNNLKEIHQDMVLRPTHPLRVKFTPIDHM